MSWPNDDQEQWTSWYWTSSWDSAPVWWTSSSTPWGDASPQSSWTGSSTSWVAASAPASWTGTPRVAASAPAPYRQARYAQEEAPILMDPSWVHYDLKMMHLHMQLDVEPITPVVRKRCLSLTAAFKNYRRTTLKHLADARKKKVQEVGVDVLF
jgi:hypothetical protein